MISAGNIGATRSAPKNFIRGIKANQAITEPPNIKAEASVPTIKPTPRREARASTPMLVP